MHTEYYRRPDGFVFAVKVKDERERERDPFTGDIIEPAYEPPAGSVPVDVEVWNAVEPHYFQSGKGRVLDMWKRLGGNPAFYLEHGWTEIDRATFQRELVRVQDYERAARDEWIADMGEDGLRRVGEQLDQFAYDMTARGSTRTG